MQTNDIRPAEHRDNLLGVCAAIGEATGINPTILRVTLVLVMLCGYFTSTVLLYLLTAIAIKLAQR